MSRKLREPVAPLAGQAILHLEHLRALGIPHSDSGLLRMEQRGEFPKRFRLSYSRVGWDAAEVRQWIEDRKAARTGEAA